MPTPSKSSGWSAADEQLLGAVRAAVGGTHEVVGTVGRDIQGLPALIAREAATGELLVLLLDRVASAESSSAELTLAERRELDDTIPAPDIPCPICRAPQVAWSHSCAVCGNEVDGSAFAGGIEPAVLLGMVRRAAADEMDVLGAISHARTGDDPGAPVFFARERSTRELVALRLTGRTVDAAGRSDITLGVIPLPALGMPAVAESADVEPTPAVRPTPAPGIATVSLLREALAAAAEPAPADSRVCPQCGAEYPAGVRFCARDGAALRARAGSKELVGQIVAEKYLVVRKLGVGGMGEVYLARHVHMGRECALKIMRRELTDDVDAAGRFRREAASASRVNHPNIATIYDFGETADGIAYIVMEYVDGEPLSAILGRDGRLEPVRAVSIARQIADALGAAHELGIVHRDLKPDNVMITRSHDAERVKVVDFGIAKAMQGGSRQLTRTGYVLGTPAYMSPEQIVGGDLDGRSDQYNLACILFEMLTGQVTFAGTTGEIVIHRRLTEPAPHPRKLEPAVPRSLDAVVVHALARTPEERFASAADFGAALAEAIDQRGARWSPLAWLGRGKGTSAQFAATSPVTITPHTPAAPPSSTGIMTPRVRPPTGTSTVSARRVAPPPEPPTSPPVARPKWPGGDAPVETEMPPRSTSAPGGQRVSVPSEAHVTAPSGESWSSTAVTGEHTGQDEIAPASAGASSTSTDARTTPPSLAPATASTASTASKAPTASTAPTALRPARSRVRLAAAGGIATVGAIGAVLYFTRHSPAPAAQRGPDRTAVIAANPDRPVAPPAGAATDSAGAPVLERVPESSAAAAESTASPAQGDASLPKQRTELRAQIARQAALARAARARAVAAGVPRSALSEGDSLLRTARAWRASGNYMNALRDGLAASQSWALAERAAAVSPSESTRRSSELARRGPAAPVSSEPASPSSNAAIPEREPATENPTRAPASGAVASEAVSAAAGTLRNYVDALSRRDLATMRKLWPSMPDKTASGFQSLFKLATSFSASLAGEPTPRVDGSDADTELRYSLDYFLPSQGEYQRSFRLHAVMRREGDRWIIRSLEPIH